MGSQYLLRLLTVCVMLTACPVWAFPDNGILDGFTGANGTSPPDSNWTNAELRLGGSGLNLQSNAVAPGTTTGYWGGYWNVQTFGPDAEAYATIVNIGSTGFGAVCVRIATPGHNTTDAYCVEWADATSAITLYRLDNGVVTQLAPYTQTITTTDKVGIKAVGNQICAWFSDNGGTWTQLGCATDATYSAAGYLGIYLNGNSTVGAMDDFGGGVVSGAAVGSLTQMRRRSLP